MPVSNEDLMDKLNKIEELLNKVSQQEDTEIAEEKKIEEEEEKELKELDESGINLEFNNPEDWRRYIWESCPFKKEDSEGAEIDFFCKKQNGPCRFEGCPLNKKIESK